MFKLHSNLRGLIAVFALFMSFATFAQNTISGTVKDDKNQTLPGVSVVIKGTTKGTISDSKGNYIIKNVASGKTNVVASFVGQKSITESIDVTSGTNTLNFTMQDDAMELESVIVTGVFDQRTKLESSVAITTLSPKIIEQRAARGTGDLLQAVPGIWTDNSSGEVGSKVVARGLAPVGNDQIGFQYLSLQEEGLPVMGAQMGFALVDMFHRNDLNTGRFEAIRGGSAAITSANSPGGIFNFISKTGGAKFAGSAAASLSLYNNNNTLKRFDVEFGGPLSSKGWGYHLGGFYRVDAGARNTPFNANEGGQIKGNITKQFAKGIFKLYGKYLNDQNSYFKEIALKNDLSAGYDGGFGDPVDINNSTTFIDVATDIPLATDYRKDGTSNPTRRFDAKNGIQNMNWSVGTELTTEIGKGWGLSLKAKHSEFDQAYLQYQGNIVIPVVPSLSKPNNLGYLQFGAGTLVSPGTYRTVPAPFNQQIQGSFVGSVLSPTYYDAKTGEVLAKVVGGVLDPNTPNKLGNFLLTTAPLNMYNQVTDNIASMAVTKEAGAHQITLGTFYSQTSINTQWFVDGLVSTMGNNSRPVRIEFPAPATAPAAVQGVPSLNAAFGGFYGTGKILKATDKNGFILQSGLAYTVTENKSVLNAYYFNDVIKASERLNIDLGIRYETVRQTGTKQGWQNGAAVAGNLGGLDKDFTTIYDIGSRVYNGQIFNYDQSYSLDATNKGPVTNTDASGDGEGFQFDYISWSAGLNYKLSNKTATYLRVSRGNKAPELDYYANNFVNVALDKKAPIETVTQAEIGFKTNSKKASLSATAFYSKLDNALLQLFISTGAVSFFTDPTFNSSRTFGLELETVVRPTENFNIRAHATLQDAKYDRLSYQNTGGSVLDAQGIVDKTKFFIESFAGNTVKDVAPVILDITPSLKIGKFTPYVNYRWFSERQGNRRNSIQLESYGVLNAGVTGDITSKFSVSVQGNNLLNSAGILLFGGYGLQGTSPEDIAVGGIKSPVTNTILPGTDIKELNALGAPVFARPILARQLSVTLNYRF